MDPASSLSSNASVLASPAVVSYRDLSRAAPTASNSMGQHGERLAEQRSSRSDPSNADAIIAQLSRKVLNLEAQVAGLNARVEVLQRSAAGADHLRNSAAALRQRMDQATDDTTPSKSAEPARFQGRYAGYSFREPVPDAPPQPAADRSALAAPPAPAWALELQATCARQHTRIRELELELALRSRSGGGDPPTPPSQPHADGSQAIRAPNSRSPQTAGKVHTPHTDRVASSAARLAAASRGLSFPAPAVVPPDTRSSPQSSSGHASAQAISAPQINQGAWPAHNLFASSAVTPLHDSAAPSQGGTGSMLDFMSSSRRFQRPAHAAGR